MATIQEIQAELARRQTQAPATQDQVQAELARRQSVSAAETPIPNLQNLQDLLIRQSKGEQGLQDEITRLREITGQTDSVNALSFDQQNNITPFPEERGETRAATELPELGVGGILSDQNQAKIAAIAPVLLTTTNNQELANIITDNFPDIGQQLSPAGELILGNNNTGAKVIVNKPGISRLDLLQGLGIAAAFTPAGRVATVAPTLTGKALLGGAAAAGTQTGIEAIQSQLGGELNEEEIALAATLGGAAELVVPAIQAIRQARQAKQLGAEAAELPVVRSEVQAGQEATAGLKEAAGADVGLFPAQQTLQPSELLKQRLLPQLDAGSKKAAQALEVQNKEAFNATAELINTIAPADVVATGSKRFKKASETAIEATKQRRENLSNPDFIEAIKEGAEVNLEPVRLIIDDFAKGATKESKISKLMNRINNLISSGRKTKRIPSFAGEAGREAKKIPPTLGQLQKAKFELDEMLEGTGDKTALGSTTKRMVVQIQKELVKQMESASPAFKRGMDTFRLRSPAVQELEDSILGQMSKIKDVNIKNISQRIFDPKAGLTNPTVVRNAKKVIDQVDPGAWDDLMRVELNRRVGSLEQLVEDLPGELVGNIPGQLRRAVFGNPSQRNALLSGMSKEQRKNFVYLDEVLRRASSGRAAGSPTTPFKEALDKLKGVSLVLRDAFLRPLETLQSTGERTLFDKNVSRLTDVMFDTKFETQLKKLRKLNPNSPAAARALAQLLNQDEEK